MKIRKKDFSLSRKIKQFLTGKSKNSDDKSLFKTLMLFVFLAWAGFGTDTLSSSFNGTDQVFKIITDFPFLDLPPIKI
jgi:hypothetical protein